MVEICCYLMPDSEGQVTSRPRRRAWLRKGMRQDPDSSPFHHQTMFGKEPNRFGIRLAFLLENARGQCVGIIIVQYRHRAL